MQASQDISALHTQSGRKTRLASAQLAAKLLFSLFAVVLMGLGGLLANPGAAHAESRTLNIEFVHTGERASITFKRNGRYDPKGLKQLNYILRDWRRNEPTKMDPRLFDLVWEVYRQSRAKGYIKVVSAYRSPATNAMLRSRSKGVAKESQHMRGTAMDFYIPGVPLKTLREIGVKMQAGGVGYYPNSGSPFVHMDVAGVRAWPRMNRQDLVRLFPDGKTVHIPSDGKPLPGYQQALAEYKRRVASGNTVMIAEEKSSSRPRNFLAMLFGGGDEDEVEDIPEPAERPAVAQPQPAPAAPRQQPVGAAQEPVMVANALPGVDAVDAPVPQARPSLRPADNSLAVALYQPPRNAAEDALQQVASGVPVPANAPADEFADLASLNVPVPTLLNARPGAGPTEGVMTASIDPNSEAMLLAEGMAVPVPAARPQVAEALLASAQAEAEAEVDEVEQAILSPEAAAALEDSTMPEMAAPIPSSAPAQAELRATPEPAPVEKPVEVASIPQETPAVESTTQFGDMFDAPSDAVANADAALPKKGGRPGQEDAERAHMAMYGGTKLTKNMIEQWALNQGKFESVAKPVKAPRVVSRSLVAPATAVPDGFRLDATTVDPSRFGAP
ncbi:DUF882 domain-containing protein [Rhizobium rosettiformans]|uniref:DUF882 domain-containing protein n=1 Tax=Rhizobium rosettiformans TaxID=1368430 RepID=UPI0028594AEB|nr:DUF882 domain-containing protein [Rhizobium rosettiformans]MDR7029334.1 uncharacterized protein YcbK (DUF882 family) [Rhizobium rosettiformans]MDR7063048.1 uncharacterized protein YcbK (DUF882 family) [Rhizobium rosettiformans]